MATYHGHYHDGQTAARHDVIVELAADGLRFVNTDAGIRDRWSFDELIASEPPRRGKPLRLRTIGGAARLIVAGDGFQDALRPRAPDVFARGIRHPKAWRWFAAALGAFIAAVLLIWQGVPLLAAAVAPMVPPHWLADWGDAMTRQITDDATTCQQTEGAAALEQMLANLDATSDIAIPVSVTVVDHKMVNAMAAPGGHVVIMRGLIDEAESPDEVAGILAHELGHVAHRHPTQALIRYAGASLLIDLFTGGGDALTQTLAQVGSVALLLNYNREMEREADAFAHEVLTSSGVGSQGLARFFQRIADDRGDDDVPAYLQTHPPLRERIGSFGNGNEVSAPALDQDAWRALKSICR